MYPVSLLSLLCQEGPNSPTATQPLPVTYCRFQDLFALSLADAQSSTTESSRAPSGRCPPPWHGHFPRAPGRKSIQNLAPCLTQQHIEAASRPGLEPPLHSGPSFAGSSSRQWTCSVPELLQRRCQGLIGGRAQVMETVHLPC